MYSETADRATSPRRYLMCRPTYFDVTYSINPWMDPKRSVSTDLGIEQWKRLHDVFVTLGHDVELLEPRPGLPDMVFAANGATVCDGRALVARFRHSERADEADYYVEWFRSQGWSEVERATYVNEGEGDFLCAGDEILAGTGFRSDPRAHDEVREFFGRTVVSLELVDPYLYHLDTALAVLSDDDVMYYPAAFSDESQKVLQDRFPHAIHADLSDVNVFGLNAVSDGQNVVLPAEAVGLRDQLRDRGYTPVGVELAELLKAGGSVKCCTLELRT
ncbi:amidinotransferase (plasmid) [Pseudonocardia sp. EC080625-04]|uniref:dimethylargininase n=1 Tax=unclassified Pseudonocardia TaxID=2619320 RepID=UPI0006CB1145|nr:MULTISPECIES: dimethylargininase [unclassified Pseudonocardia]ALE76830.1 amidinotransferase [Pseudonocardia sp. EC080625-04]ALE86279.1 amidinotransferase [Pseudonocardia sp. HH130629-09]